MSKELWVMKYAPKSLDEMVVSDEKRQLLQKIIDEVPNCLLHGPPGTGKSAFVNILINSTKCKSLRINASMNNTIDEIRNKVYSFATSFDPDNIKIVYLNEAERLSPDVGQKAILQLIEDVHKTCRFILVVNNPNKIIDPLKSRCSTTVDFGTPPAKEVYSKCVNILNKEKIKVKNKQTIVNLIKGLYPDIRKIIGTLQANNKNGVINKISYSTTYDLFSEIFSKMKSQDIEGVRKVLKSNYIQYDELYSYLYEKVVDDPEGVTNPGEFILLTGEYLFRDSQVAISEVNFMAYMFALMKGGCM